MKQARFAVVTLALCVVTTVFAGCPGNSSGNLPGKWQYVAVNTSSSETPDFRAFLTFGQSGSGGMGLFRYEEERLLPDNDEGAMSWHLSYYAAGFYRTASYGYPGASDIFTYWADTELNVIISEYAPVLLRSYNEISGAYTYTLETAALDDETHAHSHAVLVVNPFDELMIAWGNRPVAQMGRLQNAKGFSINEGIIADTYVRVSN